MFTIMGAISGDLLTASNMRPHLLGLQLITKYISRYLKINLIIFVGFLLHASMLDLVGCV